MATIARKKTTEGKAMNPAKKAPDQTKYSGRFAAKIREIREKSGLTVEQVVALLAEHGQKVPASTYYRWENGRSPAPLDMLPFIAIALGKTSVHAITPKE